MVILPYDTESKSRNVLASPLGEEGHEVAKGVQANWIHRGAPRPANPVRRHPAKSVCTRVRMIMILDVDVTAERRHYKTHRPQGRYHNPRPERPSNLRTLRPIGPVHPKNPFPQPFSTTLLHNPPPTGGHNPRGQGSRQPSRRRRVQSEPYAPGPQSGPYFLLFLHFSYRIML